MNDIIINKDNYLKGMYKMKIIKNRVRCKSCGNIIESTSTHDIKSYRCGSITVDGGKDYIRRGFKEIVDLEDLVNFDVDRYSEKCLNVVYENEKRESQMQEKNHAISFQFGIRE